MRSPLDITYNDLIKSVEKRLQWLEKNSHNSHEKECNRVLLKMLKKGEKNRQLTLGEVYENLNPKP